MQLTQIEEAMGMDLQCHLPRNILFSINSQQLEEVLLTMNAALRDEHNELIEEQRAVASLPNGPGKDAVAPALKEHEEVVQVKEAIATKLQRYHHARGHLLGELCVEVDAAQGDTARMACCVAPLPQPALWDLFVAFSREAAHLELEVEVQQGVLATLEGGPEAAPLVAQLEKLQIMATQKLEAAQWLAEEFRTRENMIREKCDMDVGEILLDDQIQLWCLTALAAGAEEEMLEMLTAIEIRKEEVEELPEGPEKDAATAQLETSQGPWEVKAEQASVLEQHREEREQVVAALLSEVTQEVANSSSVPAMWGTLSAQDREDILMVWEIETALLYSEGDEETLRIRSYQAQKLRAEHAAALGM